MGSASDFRHLERAHDVFGPGGIEGVDKGHLKAPRLIADFHRQIATEPIKPEGCGRGLDELPFRDSTKGSSYCAEPAADPRYLCHDRLPVAHPIGLDPIGYAILLS